MSIVWQRQRVENGQHLHGSFNPVELLDSLSEAESLEPHACSHIICVRYLCRRLGSRPYLRAGVEVAQQVVRDVV